MLLYQILFFLCIFFQASLTAGFFDGWTAWNKTNQQSVCNQIQNFLAVEPGQLYRSQQLRPEVLRDYIKKYGIKTVVNLRGYGNKDTTWHAQEAAVAKAWGIQFHSIAMSAVVLTEKEHLLELLKIYDTAQRPILVHCLGGADRTGEASALWVLEVQKKSKEEALKQLALAYGHRVMINKAKAFLITIWQGRDWLNKYYDAAHYPQYCRR